MGLDFFPLNCNRYNSLTPPATRTFGPDFLVQGIIVYISDGVKSKISLVTRRAVGVSGMQRAHSGPFD